MGSFRNGISALKGVAGGLADLVKSGLGLGLAAAGAAAYMATIVNAQAKIPVSAAGVKMTATEFASLAASMGIAGYGADELMGSLKKVNDQMEGLRQGDVGFAEMAKNLGLMGIGFDRFKNDTGLQRLMDVMKGADEYAKRPGNTQQGAALLVEKVLGSAGRNFYTWMKQSGTSLDQVLGMGRSATLMGGSDYAGAMEFSKQLNRLVQDLKGATNLFATSVLNQFAPELKSLGDWIMGNRSEITSTIREWSSVFGDFIKSLGTLGPAAGTFFQVLGTMMIGATTALDFLSGKKGALDTGGAALEKLLGRPAGTFTGEANKFKVSDIWMKPWTDIKGFLFPDNLPAPHGTLFGANDKSEVEVKVLVSAAPGVSAYVQEMTRRHMQGTGR